MWLTFSATFLIFVVFVTDGPHFDRMFKMVLIFAIRVLFDPFL